MKKVFLLLLVCSSLFVKAQSFIVRDKLNALQSIGLKTVTLTGFQTDTVFVGDNQVPTSKAVRDYILGHGVGGSSTDTSLLVHKAWNENITGRKTFIDSTYSNVTLPNADSSKKIPNTDWIKRQLYAQKVYGTFSQYSIPVANASGQLAATSDFTYDNSASGLNIGYAGFYSSSYINLHGGNGIISAGGSGLYFNAQGGYPVDPSKSYTFYNSGYLYLQMSTTGVAGSWDHFTDFFTRHFRVRGLSADSSTLTNTGTVHMLTVDANGQFNHTAAPTGNATHTGDVTGSTALTLATVNSNVGAFGTSTSVPSFTVNGKGLITAASATAIPSATTSVTGLLTSTDWNSFTGKQAALSGTGFVKIAGTTISYDNSTYLTTGSAVSTYIPYSGATGGVNLGSQTLTTTGQVTVPTATAAGNAINRQQLTDSLTGNTTQISTAAQAQGFNITGTGPYTFNTPAGLQIANPSANATDANYTAVTNTIKHLVNGTLTANRTITIPTEVDGARMIIYNNEAGFIWSLTGVAVYYSDGVSIVASLLVNTPYEITGVDGKWMITN